MLGADFIDRICHVLDGDETDGELAIGIDSGEREIIRFSAIKSHLGHAELIDFVNGSR